MTVEDALPHLSMEAYEAEARRRGQLKPPVTPHQLRKLRRHAVVVPQVPLHSAHIQAPVGCRLRVAHRIVR